MTILTNAVVYKTWLESAGEEQITPRHVDFAERLEKEWIAALDQGQEDEVKEMLEIVDRDGCIDSRCTTPAHLLSRALRSSQARIVALTAALAPFAEFGKNAGQFSGKGDELYIEHAKVKAVLRRSDCIAASALLKKEESSGR